MRVWEHPDAADPSQWSYTTTHVIQLALTHWTLLSHCCSWAKHSELKHCVWSGSFSATTSSSWQCCPPSWHALTPASQPWPSWSAVALGQSSCTKEVKQNTLLTPIRVRGLKDLSVGKWTRMSTFHRVVLQHLFLLWVFFPFIKAAVCNFYSSNTGFKVNCNWQACFFFFFFIDRCFLFTLSRWMQTQ